MFKTLEQMAYLNRKVLAIARLAAKAKFKLDSGHIDADVAEFMTEYVENIAKVSGGAGLKSRRSTTIPV